MSSLTVKDVERAAERLHRVLHATPLTRSETFSEVAGSDIYLKYENLQKTGSFKIRGAYNKICELKEQGEVTSVVAASAGNHAQGVAFASSLLGVESMIVMPRSTPIAKVKATEDYGAKVLLMGDCYDDACAAAQQICTEQGAHFIHPFDDLSVIAGQATIGHDILKDLPNVDIVFIPAGGGGLLAGVSFYLKHINPRIKIIGVQAAGAAAIERSFKAKQLCSIDTVSTIADGIAVKTPGTKTVNLINKYADDVMTVSDAEISSVILNLMERCKQVVEPAGAVSLAAALSCAEDLRGKRSVCLLSGGNIDVSFIHRIIEIGLVARGRKLKFKTVLPDVPGSLEQVSRLIAEKHANIIWVQYDRIGADLDPSDVILHIACEVSDREHGQTVIDTLESEGYKVIAE